MIKSHLKLTYALAGLLALIASGCGTSPQPAAATEPAPATEAPAAPAPTTAQPTAAPTSGPPQPCEAGAVGQGPQYQLTEPGTQAEVLWRSEFLPWWVRTGPEARVLAVTDGGDSIYELKPDGTLEVAFRCPGVVIETFAAASDGALWFASRDGGRLYRADPDGSVEILAQNGNRNLEAGPDGSVYAMEIGLVRIDPDGTQTRIAGDVGGRKFAIGPNGEIAALRNGEIVRISESGEFTSIASGYGPEPWLAFGPDGRLYVTHWTGVDVIDLESGEVSGIPWLKDSNIGESGAFGPDGRLLLYHPNTDVYAVDLEAETVELYHQVISNSWAMAANPGDAVYMAFGNDLANGQTSIYRVVDEQTLERVASVPYGIERSMVFDAQGIGYLAVGDQAVGGAIYSFDPASGETELYHSPQCFPGGLAVHPQTGRIWWNDCNRTFESLDENGRLVVIDAVSGGENATLAITPAGEFYSVTFFHRDDPNTRYQHGLYLWNEAGSAWEQVADLTQSDPGITLSTPVACPDGRVYTVESLDGSNLPVGRSSYNAVRRLEADGSLTLLGFDFAFDGLAADCDPATGQIIFTSGAGIFAVTPP